MVINGIPVGEFINMVKSGKVALIDARSESEYKHAHIPGSINIPLLNDTERHAVGTTYKLHGREDAVHLGFKLVGPRFHEIISNVREHSPGKEVILYCWRGGMRSQIMTWLLQMNGFRVISLKGGYKAYRNWVLDILQRPLNTIILGGPTGSGKTELLDSIKAKGEQVLPLETMANHKGSAFGGLGMGAQPSNEQFENLIAMDWSGFDAEKPVWIENESRTIGSCLLPASIFNRIRTSELVEIIVGDNRRKQRILDEYGIFPITILSETTDKIAKRLGPQHLKKAKQCLAEGDLTGWLEIVLFYYDKLYSYGSSQREENKKYTLDLSHLNKEDFADKLISFVGEKNNFNSVITSK